MRLEKPDERGRYLIPRDGRVAAFMALAYDLYIVRDNIEFQERILDCLRLRDSFAGRLLATSCWLPRPLSGPDSA